MKPLIYVLIVLVGSLFTASTYAARQCGNFTISAGNDGFMRINGERPSSQKITYLGKKDDVDNMKIDWFLSSQDGNMYGLEYFRRNDKVWLNVQLLQNSMNAPKIIGSFPCKKLPD
ncbi:hypothetical protein [Yersinia pekkanenii]|nr:hypothetical protein [Yersinia pekkanenii]